MDIVEFADLLQNGPNTGFRLVEWFLEYPDPHKYRKSVGIRDARFVFNHLHTPNYFLNVSADLAKAGALPSDLLERAEDLVQAVPPKRDGGENLQGQAAAFRKVIPFWTMVHALRAYRAEGK